MRNTILIVLMVMAMSACKNDRQTSNEPRERTPREAAIKTTPRVEPEPSADPAPTQTALKPEGGHDLIISKPPTTPEAAPAAPPEMTQSQAIANILALAKSLPAPALPALPWDGVSKYYSGLSSEFHRILPQGHTYGNRDDIPPGDNYAVFYWDRDERLRYVVCYSKDRPPSLYAQVIYGEHGPIANITYYQNGYACGDYVEYFQGKPFLACRVLGDARVYGLVELLQYSGTPRPGGANAMSPAKAIERLKALSEKMPKSLAVPAHWDGKVRYFQNVSVHGKEVIGTNPGPSLGVTPPRDADYSTFYYDREEQLVVVVKNARSAAPYVEHVLLYDAGHAVARGLYVPTGLLSGEYTQYDGDRPYMTCGIMPNFGVQSATLIDPEPAAGPGVAAKVK